jgi:hypothetical protein
MKDTHQKSNKQLDCDSDYRWITKATLTLLPPLEDMILPCLACGSTNADASWHCSLLETNFVVKILNGTRLPCTLTLRSETRAGQQLESTRHIQTHSSKTTLKTTPTRREKDEGKP